MHVCCDLMYTELNEVIWKLLELMKCEYLNAWNLSSQFRGMHSFLAVFNLYSVKCLGKLR